MDKQRIILFGLLVIIGSILWNDWNVQHQLHQQAIHSGNNIVATQQMSPRAQQQTAASQQAASVSTQAASQNSSIPDVIASNLIHVRTDVLNVAIDKKTGAIVRAYLIKYPVSLHQKDNPVKILSHDDSHYKIALNGLVEEQVPAFEPLIDNCFVIV